MKLRHVIFHYPGAKWKYGYDFREQEEAIVREHVQHYRKLQGQGNLLLGGPFTDIDSGGMMIADGEISREEIEEYAASDPAVKAGVLKFEVKTWYTAMSK
jgi:uncharacterized protein YciI